MRRLLKLIFFFFFLISSPLATSAQNVTIWSGDTTINGNKTILSISYPVDSSWQINLENDKVNQTNDAANEGTPPQLLFQLYNSYDSTANGRRLEGTLSNDSSTITGILFLNDSLSFPITLHKGRRNIEENAANVYSTCLIWWLNLWLLFSLLMLLYFRGRRKSFQSSSDKSMALPGNEWLLKTLPIVRISCKKTFLGNVKAIIVHKDFIFLFQKNKKTIIDKLHDEDSHGLITATHGLKNIKQILIDQIKKIEVEKESRLGKVRFSIYYGNKRENYVLPGYEMPNLLIALQSIAGNNLKTNLPIKFHSYGIWIQLFLFSFAALYLYQNILHPENPFVVIIFIILFIVVLSRILFLLFFSIGWFMDHLPGNLNKPKLKKENPDLSHHKPFRSVPIAIFLKVVGAAIFVLTFLFLKQQYLPVALKNFILPLGNYLNGFLIVFGYLLVGLILNLSLAFANKNPKAPKQNDTRQPILYLRSFLDDRETTFQPGTWLSYFMGVDPPYYQLSKYMFISDSLFYRLNKKIYKYFYNNHPVRMLRLILGWPADTSEQQLELFFRKKGPFVAIGKPGERIITSGASRMYVTNEEWQNVVIDYLNKSQLVVLQPSSTEGIWWEINQSLNIVDPSRLFLCMVNYKGHQNSYEDFRLRFENLKSEVKLPRFIGNAKEICFLRFDNEWNPLLLRLTYKNFIYWPFIGNAADLKKSLKI